MVSKLVIVCLAALSAVNAVDFHITNKLPGAVWVGILGNSGKPPLANGGLILQADETVVLNAPEDWAGRFWARTYCDSTSNHCETGDCGNRLECAGAGGVPPVSLAEITLKGWEGMDFYDLSLVDGFNVPLSIGPMGGEGDCKPIVCAVDMNPSCPTDLQLIGSVGYAIACNSACNKYNTDEYCCRGAWGTPDTCDPSTWGDHNSAAFFKANCPDAYSYAYDDQTSTFTCKSSAYSVTFG